MENMKNDATFVCMRSGDHFGDAKMSKRGISLRRIYLFINCDRHKRFLQNERKRGQVYKIMPQIFKLLCQDLVMIFQSSVMILPRFFFSTLKDHNVCARVRVCVVEAKPSTWCVFVIAGRILQKCLRREQGFSTRLKKPSKFVMIGNHLSLCWELKEWKD